MNYVEGALILTLNKIFIIKRHRLELMEQSLELQVSFLRISLRFRLG